MIKKAGLFGLCLALLTLAACSNSSYLSKAKNIESWKQIRDQLESLNEWGIRGKISIRSAAEVYTADLFWQQNNEDLKLRLVAPFSQAATEFTGSDENGYQVLTDQGQRIDVDSPELVTEHAFGVSLPFTELKSWVKGVPYRDSPVWQASFNEDNRLQAFQQNGWQVKILKYRKIKGTVLPSKLFLSRLNEDITDNKVDIRIILLRWVI